MSLEEVAGNEVLDEGLLLPERIFIKGEPFTEFQTTDYNHLDNASQEDICSSKIDCQKKISSSKDCEIVDCKSRSETDHTQIEYSNNALEFYPLKIKQEASEGNECDNNQKGSTTPTDGACTIPEITYSIEQEEAGIESYETNLPTHNAGCIDKPKQGSEEVLDQKQKKTADIMDIHSCEQCEKTYSLRDSLMEHIKNLHSKIHNLQCRYCPMVFNIRSEFNAHNVIHTGQRCICSLCKKYFKNETELHDHVIAVHAKEPPFNCHVCWHSFEDRKSLRQHFRTHKALKRYVCEKCSKSFSVKSGLTAHEVSKHSNVRNFACEICKKTFPLQHCLTIHMTIHTGERPFKCKLCAKSFRVKSILTEHVATHSTDRKNYECDVCSATFLNKKTIKLHMSKHFDKDQFKCTLCSKTYSHQGSFTTHLAKHKFEHQAALGNGSCMPSVSYPCSQCGKIYAHEGNLAVHYKAVHCGAEKRFSCQLCERTFSYSNGVKLHMKLNHSNEPKIKCRNCPMVFKQRSDLDAHNVIHTGLRCICTLCSKPFILEPELHEHVIKAHAIKPPFNCHLCPESFKISEGLRQHFATHKTVKRYVCGKCGITFTQSTGLKRHDISLHTNVKSFVCEICSKTFAVKGSLTSHMKSHNLRSPVQSNI